MKRVCSSFALAVLLLSGTLMLPASGIDGAWNLVLNTEIGVRQMQIMLSTDGEAVSAKLGHIPLNGSYREGKLRLVAKDYYDADAGFKADVVVEGTVDGDSLMGRWTFAEYSGPLEGQRTATAVTPGTKVDGIWDIVFVTEIGDRPVRVRLQSEGDTVIGFLGEQRMEGTLRDGALVLKLPKFYSEDAGFTAELVLQGKVDGDSLVGRWSFGEYSGPAKGKRSAE